MLHEYTIVWTDHGVCVPSNGTAIVRAENVKEARDCFERERAKGSKMRVVGIFVGAQTEQLSRDPRENAYLGQVSTSCVDLVTSKR